MARCILLKGIKAICDGGGECFYTDTDSILFKLGENQKLPKEIKIHPKELGCYKVEKIFNCFRSNGKCKKYHISLRGVNIDDDNLIDWVKNNHPNWVWQHLEGKPLEKWKDLLSIKLAASGFNKKEIKKLPLNIIDTLYSPNENILVARARKLKIEDKLTKVSAITLCDSSFNTWIEGIDDSGNLVDRGNKEITGILQKQNNEWKLYRMDEIPNYTDE